MRPLPATSRHYFALITAVAVFFWGMVLASGFAQKGPETSQSSLSADLEREQHRAEEAARQARGRVEVAKRELSSYVAQHFNGHVENLQRLETVSQPAPQQQAEVLQPNPQYRELAGRLHDLKLKRSDLLERLTPEHPEIKDLDANRVEVERRLAATPEFLSAPANAGSLGLAIAPQQAINQQQIERDRAALVGYESLRQRVSEAEESLRLAAQAERRNRGSQAAAVSIAVSGSQDSAKRWSILALVTALALVAAAAVALLGRGKATTFTSVPDIEASLRIPVVGVIGDARRRSAPKPAMSGLVRGLMLMSELTLALFIFSLVVLAIDNVTFLRALLTDPVSGFAYGMQRLIALSLN